MQEWLVPEKESLVIFLNFNIYAKESCYQNMKQRWLKLLRCMDLLGEAYRLLKERTELHISLMHHLSSLHTKKIMGGNVCYLVMWSVRLLCSDLVGLYVGMSRVGVDKKSGISSRAGYAPVTGMQRV